MRTILLMMFPIRMTFGLLGYDCGGSTLNVTTISLLDVGECHSPTTQPNSTSVYIQLLQVADFTEISAISCKIEIDRQIFYCGMHSHISLVRGGGRRKYIMDIKQEQCSRLHEIGSIILGDSHTIIELTSNNTHHRILTLAGSSSVDGSCVGGHFSDPYGSWDDVVVEASLTITLRDYYAAAKTKEDSLKLRSGIQCKLSKNQCIDEDGANVYWAPLPSDSCNFHAYNVLYQGLATKISDINATQYPVVYSLTSKDVTFALSKTSEHTLCGYTLIQTEHPKLLIVETTRNNPFAKQTSISVNNLDIFAYINSKFIYVEKHLKTQMQNLYRNIIEQKCRLERQVLKNAVAIAQSQPEIFAYSLMKGPGYMAIVSGEVAHIIKCVPTEVTRRSTEKCYRELPVSLQNQSMYLSPKTHILLGSGTPVDCNPIIPIMYKINGGWISFTPKPAAVLPPQTLEPMIEPVWKYVDAEHLAESGIYSSDDLNRLRDHIMFPVESTALLNTFARSAAGHRVPTSGISISNLLDEASLEKLSNTISRKLWGGFMEFGTASAGFIGIWILIRLIKLIADTAIHGYALHSIYGWSLHLLGAIFASITNLLLHLGRQKPSRPSLKPNDIQPSTGPSIRVDGPQLTLPPPPPPPSACPQYSRPNNGSGNLNRPKSRPPVPPRCVTRNENTIGCSSSQQQPPSSNCTTEQV